jgi:hypothetical protein
VLVEDLGIGELLAEGGEGRVYEVPLRPHLVYKSYRRPVPREYLQELCSWPDGLPDIFRPRLDTASAWPAVLVEDGGAAVGLLMARAPRRFALRHRDGTTRLASLSYLTADPAHRAIAYGLRLPPEASPERFGLVYALARLLEAFDAGSPRVAHGDLSAKNVLWSLQRGPEVFVIDCDNSERFADDGQPMGQSGRRRAMTPNWEDPAVAPGHNPTPESDRYSLALILLRVAGAANFPIQGRQRVETAISVDFALPPSLLSQPALSPDAPIWALCRRGLSVAAPENRPVAAEWVGVLEEVLDSMGAANVAEAVRVNQGGGRPAANQCATVGPAPADVAIRPILRAVPRPEPRITRLPQRPSSGGGFRSAPVAQPAAAASIASAVPDRGPSTTVQAMSAVVQGIKWWTTVHRRAAGGLATSGRRAQGLASLAVCMVLDALALLVGLFFVAMIVAPISGL